MGTTLYYQDDACQIWLGDCRDVLPTLDATAIDAIVTDPPYGVGLTGKKTKRVELRPAMLYDDRPEAVWPAIAAMLAWRAAHTVRAVIMPGIRLLHTYPAPADMGCIFHPSGAGRSRWGFGCFTPILYYGTCPYNARGLGGRPNSFQGNHIAPDYGGQHPAAKPLDWMLWLVKRGSLPGETVLDPFMGSGTTLQAAKDLGRKAIGIEMDERFCEMAVRRLQQEVLPLSCEPEARQTSGDLFC